MPANILDAPVNCTSAMSFTPSAGASYAFIWAVRRSSSGTVDPFSAVTLGGQSATLVAGYSTGSGYLRSIGGLWAINESQIAAMSGNAIVTTGGFGTALVISLSITGVAQVLPTSGEFGQVNPADSVSATLDRSIDLNRTTDGITLAFQHWSGISNAVTMVDPSRDVNISDAGSTASIAYQTDTTTGLLATSWNSVDTTRHASFLAVSFNPAPAQAITNVNGGAGIKIGSTGNTATVTGAPSAATGGTFGGRPITVTNWNSVTGVATFTAPDIVHGEAFPDIDSLQTLTITGSGWSASLPNVQLKPPAGSTAVIVASPDNADPHKLGVHIIAELGITPANGDKLYGIDAVITWLPDTGYENATITPPSLVTQVRYWDASTGIGYVLNVTIPVDGAIIIDGGLSSVGLTSTGLTAIGLTAVGL